MKILLDIDGVMVTTPGWRVPEKLADGFMKFNEVSALNLERFIREIESEIVLTSTHRINYSVDQWREIFSARGIHLSTIAKVNSAIVSSDSRARVEEVVEWIELHGSDGKFLIIDDDLSLNSLSISIRDKCVLTKSLIGFDQDALNKALAISRSL